MRSRHGFFYTAELQLRMDGVGGRSRGSWLTSANFCVTFLLPQPSFLLPTRPSPARRPEACPSSTAGCVSP